MFGKGTFKSSGAFRPSASVAVNQSLSAEKIACFTEAEKAYEASEAVKAVQLYTKFLHEAENVDEGSPTFLQFICF